MKLSALVSTAALASTSSAAALSTTHRPRDLVPKYICETTEGSPLLHHVNQLIGNLIQDEENDHWCVWHGVGEDECKSQKGFSGDGGGAVFAVCRGPGGDQPFRVSFLDSKYFTVGLLGRTFGGCIRNIYIYFANLDYLWIYSAKPASLGL